MVKEVPTWVADSTVIAIHRRQIAEHGGTDGIRDRGLLESALAKPKNLCHYEGASLSRLAASYAYGIARNHAFLDGNKRTAFVVCELFLRLNGKTISATAEDKYTIFLSLAEGRLSEADLTIWIEENLAVFKPV